MAKRKTLFDLPKKPYIITVACQKGGVGKTTTSIILSYILSELGYHVLACDADQQGNMTETLLALSIRQRRLDGYVGILDALTDDNPQEYVEVITDNLHLMPGDENAGFFVPSGTNANFVVRDMLSKLTEEYDFIIIDTAPGLCYMLTNCLVASDGMLAMYQPETYCYAAIFTLFETMMVTSQLNPRIKPIGILPSLTEVKRSDMQEFLHMIRNNPDLGKYVFQTVIRRSAPTGRLSYAGLQNNPEIKKAVDQYRPFVEELLQRVQES